MLTWRGYIDGKYYHIWHTYGLHTDPMGYGRVLYTHWGISSWESLFNNEGFLGESLNWKCKRGFSSKPAVYWTNKIQQRFSMDERWRKMDPLSITLSQLTPRLDQVKQHLKKTPDSHKIGVCATFGEVAWCGHWPSYTQWHNGEQISVTPDSRNGSLAKGAVGPWLLVDVKQNLWFTDLLKVMRISPRLEGRLGLNLIDHPDQKWTKHEQEFLMLSEPIDAQLFAFGGSNSYLPTIMESLFKGGGQNFSKSLAGWHGSVAFNSLSQHIL